MRYGRMTDATAAGALSVALDEQWPCMTGSACVTPPRQDIRIGQSRRRIKGEALHARGQKEIESAAHGCRSGHAFGSVIGITPGCRPAPMAKNTPKTTTRTSPPRSVSFFAKVSQIRGQRPLHERQDRVPMKIGLETPDCFSFEETAQSHAARDPVVDLGATNSRTWRGPRSSTRIRLPGPGDRRPDAAFFSRRNKKVAAASR